MLALDRKQQGSVQFLTSMSQYICHATSASRKAGRLSTNTAQSLDRLSTNKADLNGFRSTETGEKRAYLGLCMNHICTVFVLLKVQPI